MLEEIENPELYDLRLGSGVVREDEGVTLLRGINGGDGADGIPADEGVSGWGVVGVKGIGGGLAFIDILFILRASVGLIVLAANPVACALFGRTDILLLEEGVVVLRFDRAGEWGRPLANDSKFPKAPVGVRGASDDFLGGA